MASAQFPTASAANMGRTAAEAMTGECFPIAMAYVPWQYWTETYPLERALRAGTIFCELDKPFTGRRACR